jgi:hypothetical protein
MYSPRRILAASLFIGISMVFIGMFQSLREDIDAATNLKPMPTSLSYRFNTIPENSKKTDWFDKTNMTYSTTKKLPGTQLKAKISTQAVGLQNGNDTYLDFLEVHISGEQNGEQVLARIYPVVSHEDDPGIKYQTSRVRLEVCRYSLWKRVLGWAAANGCVGDLANYEFKISSKDNASESN